ncbi:MAG: dienelactone hydrolase family protein [Bryobacteraceae bacterium]
MSENICITTLDGTFSAYVARPNVQPAPAIVVLHEVFGVNSDMRATCQELADRGYIAICPDLFWRQEPGLDLSHWTDAEWKKGLELYNAYNLETGVSDIEDTITAARNIDGASGKVGVMGFCLGGLLTFLTSAQGNADGAVAYYPGSAENHLEEAAAVSIPLMVHLGEEDEFISKDAQQKIKNSFATNSEVTIYSYPGCSHAFARHTGVHYDAPAARIANDRTWAFFDQELR